MAVRITTDEVLEQMRRSGGRVTAQRRLVLDALVATQPHPSVDDVVGHVERHDPDLHRSTIYRTLNTLADLGVISHVHLDHGRSVYHFTHDANPHLVCRVCGAVTHLDAERFRAVRELVADATGFDLEHGHFAWTARCSGCRAAGRTTGDGHLGESPAAQDGHGHVHGEHRAHGSAASSSAPVRAEPANDAP